MTDSSKIKTTHTQRAACEATMLEWIRAPSTTAAHVSSQDVSMARITRPRAPRAT